MVQHVRAQSRPTLCNPMGCSLPVSSVHEILQARILEWVARPSSTGSFDPGTEPAVSCLHRQVLYHLSYLGSQIWCNIPAELYH